MLVLVHGQDSYQGKQKINKLLAGQKADFFDFYNNPDFCFTFLKDVLNSGSLFEEQKNIVLRDVFSNSAFKNEFLERRKELNTTDLIIFFETKKTKDLNKYFEKVYEFELLKTPDLRSWIRKTVKEMDCLIDQEAINFLIKAVQSDLWRMSMELKKLSAFDKKITKKNAEFLVKPDINVQIFKTIEAIASKDRRKALSLIHEHFRAGDHPSYLLAMIAYQFRTLIILKDPRGVSGLSPFVVRKNKPLSQRFTLEDLQKIYSKIFKMDFKLKTGEIKPEMALELLISDI